jgi:hypothetical protein
MPSSLAGSAASHAAQAQTASAWGQHAISGQQQALAYRDAFQARAMGQQVPEQAWLAARTGFQHRQMPSCTGYSCQWSPMLTGSGIRGQDEAPGASLDDIADQVAADMFG